MRYNRLEEASIISLLSVQNGRRVQVKYTKRRDQIKTDLTYLHFSLSLATKGKERKAFILQPERHRQKCRFNHQLRYPEFYLRCDI